MKNPRRVDGERLIEHMNAIGGWYWEDTEMEITPEYVMSVISAISDPRSDFYALMRRENVPASPHTMAEAHVLQFRPIIRPPV